MAPFKIRCYIFKIFCLLRNRSKNIFIIFLNKQNYKYMFRLHTWNYIIYVIMTLSQFMFCYIDFCLVYSFCMFWTFSAVLLFFFGFFILRLHYLTIVLSLILKLVTLHVLLLICANNLFIFQNKSLLPLWLLLYV